MHICSYINIYISIYTYIDMYIYISANVYNVYIDVCLCIYMYIYTYINIYIYIDFIIYTYWVYLWKYIYVYTYIQMIPIKRTTYFHLLQYLKRKKMYFQNVKSISNLCRSWRRLCTVHIIQIYVNQIYYILHTMIHIKRTTYFHLLKYLKRKKNYNYFQNVQSMSNLCHSWRRFTQFKYT